MNEIIITIAANITKLLRLLPARPGTNLFFIVFTNPAKIAHIKLATFDKDHVVNRLDYGIENLVTKLGREIRVFRFHGRGDGGHFFGRQGFASRQRTRFSLTADQEHQGRKGKHKLT